MNVNSKKQAPVVVGISGASGAAYGIGLLRALKSLGIASACVISRAAGRTIELETGLRTADVAALADSAYDPGDIAAPLASGSFITRGMIIAPCSIKTLSAVANSYGDNLLTRAADVHLKERRPLVLMVRETPLHGGHLELMSRCDRYGAVILPPVPAFYHQPKTIDDIINQSVGKALDALGIGHDIFARWEGP